MQRRLTVLGDIYNRADNLRRAAVKLVCRAAVPDIPYKEQYQPFYSPWEGREFQAEYRKVKARTLVKPERCYMLLKLLETTSHVDGEIWECGTYRGGTARLLADHVASLGLRKTVRLFDTFSGMPATDARKDLHEAGDFSDTSPEEVAAFVGHAEQVVLHPGCVPDTFAGLESARLSFVHIDLDIYEAIKATLKFIYPRLAIGGIIVFDDYGFPTCPGAKAAVDEILGRRIIPLRQGQAAFFKNSP